MIWVTDKIKWDDNISSYKAMSREGMKYLIDTRTDNGAILKVYVYVKGSWTDVTKTMSPTLAAGINAALDRHRFLRGLRNGLIFVAVGFLIMHLMIWATR